MDVRVILLCVLLLFPVHAVTTDTIVMESESYGITILNSASGILSLACDIVFRNLGVSEVLIEFYTNRGLNVFECTVDGEETGYAAENGGFEWRNRIVLEKKLAPHKTCSVHLNLFGIPIGPSYNQLITPDGSQIILMVLVFPDYKSAKEREVYLRVPKGEFPVILGEPGEFSGGRPPENVREFSGGTPPRDEYLSRAAQYEAVVDYGEHVVYNFTAKSGFRVQVGRFVTAQEERGGITCKAFLAEVNRDLLPVTINTTLDCLELFSDRFCPYPYKEYTVVADGRDRPGGSGTGEAGWCLLSDVDNLYVISHEVGHTWFGNIIKDVTDDERWIAEGAGVYCSTLAGEALRNEEFFGWMRDIEREYNLARMEREGTLVDGQSYNVLYYKGGMLYRTLQWLMGNETFFSFTHELFRRYYGKEVTLDGFISLVNEYGDYSWFLDQWLYREGVPFYSVENIRQEGDRLEFDVVQDEEQYNLPLEISFRSGGKDSKRIFWIDEKIEHISVNMNADSIVLDPEHYLLKGYDPETEDPKTRWTYEV